MPRLKRFFGQKHLHYVTANREARIFGSDRRKRKFGTPWMIFGCNATEWVAPIHRGATRANGRCKCS